MESHVKRVEKMAAIGEMAAGLAHEIKNPLASLRGSIQLLNDCMKYDADIEKLIKIILRETDRLNLLVNDFLLFAKPPIGKLEKIDLNKVISEIIELFKKNSNLFSKKISIIKNIEQNIFIEFDLGHLHQIIWNLLLNAAEAVQNNQSGGLIEINIFTAKSKQIAIQVKDNGCGIPEDLIKSIFDPFFTTKQNGTGLGLSIVHRIIQYYDAFFDVKSHVNKGSTFTLNLKQL